jgi:hypothetical protein
LVGVGSPSAEWERFEAFAGEVPAEAVDRPMQAVNGGLYLRGLIEGVCACRLSGSSERLGRWR